MITAGKDLSKGKKNLTGLLDGLYRNVQLDALINKVLPSNQCPDLSILNIKINKY